MPGKIGTNYQSQEKKLSLCFLGSHAIGIIEKRR